MEIDKVIEMKRIKSFESNSICYLIATPIGNLGDMSSRAIEILNSVDIIACEDTRNTSLLLSKFGVHKTLISYHEHNEQECSQKLLKTLKNGQSIAIVSDAGYPGISDPGSIMVKHCIDEDIPVSVVPGANALLPALISSGLDTKHFYYHGFLPSKPTDRRKELETLKNINVTLIFYESPHRIIETLNDMYNVLGDRNACLCRELTKLHEEFIRGSLSELKDIDKTTLKGEMVLVIEGMKAINKEYTDEELIELIKKELESGTSLKSACLNISNITNIKKNKLYNLMVKNK